MLNFVNSLTDRFKALIMQGAKSQMSDQEFLEKEISRWKYSPQRITQIKGHLYYYNEHDILSRRRTMIGDGCKLQVV